MYRVYISGSYTLSETGKWFGVSYVTVSRVVKTSMLEQPGLP